MVRQMPTPLDAAKVVADHFGVTVHEAIGVMRTPLHPKTLRDEFAAAAWQMQDPTYPRSARAGWAYEDADALLAARLTTEN